MNAWLAAVVVLCVVVLTAVLISTLFQFKRAAGRAETVLQLIEREIRPIAGQIESLAAELRTLSRQANRELERLGSVVRRVEDMSVKLARLVGVVGSFTRVGQVAAVATGVKKGLDVFVSRLRNTHR